MFSTRNIHAVEGMNIVGLDYSYQKLLYVRMRKSLIGDITHNFDAEKLKEWLHMINQILDVVTELDSLIGALIAGTFTFWVTKYNYHKDIPLDKYEIAYNRVYYPVYHLISSNKDLSDVIKKSDLYFKKYMKYVDKSTIVSFRNLQKNTTKEKSYMNFRDNIYAMNSKLRRRLGYLEPDIFSMYKYSSPSDKRLVRIFLELLGIYFSIFLNSILKSTSLKSLLLDIR